jgi:hypothetical protein
MEDAVMADGWIEGPPSGRGYYLAWSTEYERPMLVEVWSESEPAYAYVEVTGSDRPHDPASFTHHIRIVPPDPPHHQPIRTTR